MAKLTSQHKTFIVRELACYKRPKEVLESFQDLYPNVKLTSKQVSYYNPCNNAGKELGQQWIELFYQTQQDYKNGILELPLSIKQKRIDELTDLYYRMKDLGLFSDAAKMLEQIKGEVKIDKDHSNQTTIPDHYQMAIKRLKEELK